MALNTEYVQFFKKWFASATPVSGAKATGTLTFTGIPVVAETVTVGENVYEFVAVAGDVADPTNIPVVLGVTLTADNAVTVLALEISSNSALVDAVANTTTDTVLVVARKLGTEGNVASTQTCTNATWTDDTLTGGVYATPVSCSAFIIIDEVWYVAENPVTKYTIGGWKSATPA